MEFLLSVFLQWFDRPITLQVVLLAIAPLPPQVERWWFSTKFDLWLLFGRLLGGAQMTNNGFWCLNLHKTLWTYGCCTDDYYLRWSLLGFKPANNDLPRIGKVCNPSMLEVIYISKCTPYWSMTSLDEVILASFVSFGVAFPWDLFKPNIIKVVN